MRDEQGGILYAPLRGVMARANDAAIALAMLAAMAKDGQVSAAGNESRATLDTLRKHGFFDVLPEPSEDNSFKPTQVTLFPTNACNLRCTYCYASGGEGGDGAEPITTMSLAAGCAAIDLVARNARERNDALGNAGRGHPRNFLVSIHGNGEPFSAFPLLRELVFHAQDVAEELDVPLVLNAASNGVLTEEQLDFMVANFSNVNISFDGLPEFQRANRPLAGGGDSFAAVDRTMRRLGEAGMRFGIRVTVTTEMVDRLAEIAAFVAEGYPGCEQLHVEPVWECGRCLKSSNETPDPQRFIDNYRKAFKRCQGTAMRMVYSGSRLDVLSDAFCKAAHGSFTVTPAGDVTSCYEVSYRSDPRSEFYFFGAFDEAAGEYRIAADKLARLGAMTVANMPYCRDCFCKWHCAGDCSAKLGTWEEPSAHAGSYRCAINRALTFDQIQRRLDWRAAGEDDDKAAALPPQGKTVLEAKQ